MPRLSLAKLERHLYAAADRMRQEGLDAATYKDYIFGMLFLKRCSDVFEAERDKIVGRKVAQGMAKQAAEIDYGENPNFYDEFFVPERARWQSLVDKLNDATVVFGAEIDKALGALSEANESLEHVLDHISFIKTQGNKRILSDEACKDLVRHFGRHRLRNEDFQFSDLLGAAYEFLINMFAESAGKKGGDFYTPRDVIRLMVRILKPSAGMSVYDPTCGSGGMLIISREFVEQSGGDPSNLRLCGQVNDASAWSICRLNMLLHDVPGSDIQLEDTLLHPMHREAGELERFDRVIANPPFSQNYSRGDAMEFKERFRWGWCPTTGKKADLMFAQHMLAVCKTNGMVATVLPHGVLFRGSAEREIRRKFLEQDLIEAVIGLPQNLFYGAGIPACILIMRPNLTGTTINANKPENRRGKVLFINADAEFHAGRAQNYLRPEHVEKITSTFERYEDIPNYARVVSLEEIASEANDFNLNIRRYVDNSPPPEPHDVRAHLLGGVPMAEIDAKQPLFDALSFDRNHVFVGRDRRPGGPPPRYVDFAPALTDRSRIRLLIDADPGVLARQESMHQLVSTWWLHHAPRLVGLPQRRELNRVRTELLDSFVAALVSMNTLDRFKLAGVVATWWTDTLPDIKTLMENGFSGVIDGWVDAIADAVEDDEAAGPVFDPFSHKLVTRAMTDYLARIAATKAEVARYKGEKEAFEQSNAPEDLEEEEAADWNYAKDLEKRIREVKSENRAALKALSKLENATLKPKATETDRRAYEAARKPLAEVLANIETWETALVPYEEIRTHLAKARELFRELIKEFVNELRARCANFSEEENQTIVLGLFVEDIQTAMTAAVGEKRQELVRFVEGVWDKYRVTLAMLRDTRVEIENHLSGIFSELKYS